jgi:hypothetical protein
LDDWVDANARRLRPKARERLAGPPTRTHLIGRFAPRPRASLPARACGAQQAVLSIVSDGLPTDGDLAAAMRPLSALPVWVVVRLCTDESHVLEFWGSLDAQLELQMDVLDDLASEALEIGAHNPWLTYAPAVGRTAATQRTRERESERAGQPMAARERASERGSQWPRARPAARVRPRARKAWRGGRRARGEPG